MNKYQKTVEYIENNKKKIVIGAVGAVALIGGIVCVAMGKKPIIAKDFTVADAGKLGEELLKIDGVTMDTAM